MKNFKNFKGLTFRQWTDETEKENVLKEIKRGDEVVDFFGDKGIVVKIEKPYIPTIEDHGTIYVWQSEQTEYGDDNCQHYTFLHWQKMLKIVS